MHWRRKWHPTPVLLPGESHGQGALMGFCPWGCKESWTVACQAPLSTGFSRQEYWSGLPRPPPGGLPKPGIEPVSPMLQADSLPLSHQGSPHTMQILKVGNSLNVIITLIEPHSYLEKEMATHSSILAWRIPWTEEPGGLLSIGSHRVGHN